MTELQKLSLKKLRKIQFPLFVLDKKSKSQAFVILDAQAYERMAQGKETESRQGRNIKEVAKTLDYRRMGLLWDRPDVSNEGFQSRLKDSGHEEHLWAGKRLLEYARSSEVKKILSLEEIREILSRVRLRPIFQEAWNRAVHYWSENP